MKQAIKVIETRTTTIVVEADDYLEAEEKVKNAYDNGNISLDYDNSSIDMEVEDDTENYIDIFGEDEFQKMDAAEI